MDPGDDKLDRLLRAADPSRTRRDEPLSARELATMERIIAGPPHSARGYANQTVRLSLVGSVLVALVAVVAVVLALSPVQTAVALTPTPLNFAPTGLSAQEVLQMSIDELSARDAQGEARRHTEQIGWYLHLDNIGTEAQTATISPEVTTVTWHPDQSGRVTIVAADSSQINGSTAGIPQDSVAPGTVLSDMEFQPGTFDAPTADPPPDTAEGMHAWLKAMGLVDGPGGADYMDTINKALWYWTLTDHQQALLIELLRGAGDAVALGVVEDRLGRPAWGVSADSQTYPGIRQILLLSATTGRIVGFETMRTSPVDGIPAGAVISYTIWETQ